MTNEKAEEIKNWLAIRKEAGLHIDPDTAEVEWIYAQTLDPYGIDPELPQEYWQVGREYFARSPKSDVWVSFGDLPKRPETPCGGNTASSATNRGIALCRSKFRVRIAPTLPRHFPAPRCSRKS